MIQSIAIPAVLSMPLSFLGKANSEALLPIPDRLKGKVRIVQYVGLRAKPLYSLPSQRGYN